MEPLQGKFLIASPQMKDPNFHRTVVLVIRDDDDGTMGLVLNRPLELTIKEVCAQALEATCNAEGNLHQGGPCDGPLMVLHSEEMFGATSGAMKVLPGVWFTTDRESIEGLLSGSPDRMKCFVGYAGWGDGQLDGEMTEGAWLVHSPRADEVFSLDPRQWSKLMTQVTLGSEIDPRRIPDDPSVN